MGSRKCAIAAPQEEEKPSLQEIIALREAELSELKKMAAESEYFERMPAESTRRPFTIMHLVGVLSTLLVVIPIVAGIGYGLYQIGFFWCCAAMVFLGACGRK